MTPADVARLRNVEEAVVSPDGTAVAYLLEVPRIPFEDPDGPAWSELWVVADDGAPRPYVTGAVNLDDVAWIPDGRGISYLAAAGDTEEAPGDALHVIPRDGGESRVVLSHPEGIDAYSWSPDGARVAFLAREEPSERAEELDEAGFDAEVFEEDRRFTRLWVTPVDPSVPRDDEAADPSAEPLGVSGEVHTVRWCPAGDRLAVTVAPDPSIDSYYMFRRIRIVDPASGEVVTAIDNPGKLADVEWSPDCSHLSFVSGVDLHDPAQGRLMVASASDGSFRNVVPEYPGHIRDALWVDGDTLLFLGDVGVESKLYRVGRDGKDRTLLLDAGERVWDGLDLGGESRLALEGESARHPAELFTAELQPNRAGEPPMSVRPVRRTDSNPWLAEVDLAPQEVVTYEARDGLEIQGLLLRPLERRGRHPLILKVHGGPEAHYRDGWLTSYSSPGQVAAARGYAVFYPNYRGSTGRGVEFSKLSQGRSAAGEFEDLVDGADHLIEIGLVDADRVGITGRSHGGYASAWGATYLTEHFAASVMGAGASDKISKLGTADIPEELYLVHERKRLWEDWMSFLEVSPIYYVERARTPLLILVGTEDRRVDPGQSLELYRHLKTLDRVPVRLVRYPGEPHGTRRAASRYDAHLRMMRWFDHFLKDGGDELPPWRIEYPLRGAEQGEPAEE